MCVCMCVRACVRVCVCVCVCVHWWMFSTIRSTLGWGEGCFLNVLSDPQCTQDSPHMPGFLGKSVKVFSKYGVLLHFRFRAVRTNFLAVLPICSRNLCHHPTPQGKHPVLRFLDILFGFFADIPQQRQGLVSAEGNYFICQICRKRFSLKDNLLKHILTHNKPKPFKCEVCQSSFEEQSSLEEHFELNHTSMNDNTTSSSGGRSEATITHCTVTHDPNRINTYPNPTAAHDDPNISGCTSESELTGKMVVTCDTITHGIVQHESNENSIVSSGNASVSVPARAVSIDRTINEDTEGSHYQQLDNTLSSTQFPNKERFRCLKLRRKPLHMPPVAQTPQFTQSSQMISTQFLDVSQMVPTQFPDGSQMVPIQFPHISQMTRLASRSVSLKCNSCQKIFRNKRYLFHHRVLVHGEPTQYQCHRCGKYFPVATQLKRHIPCTKKLKDLKCEQCGKGFSSDATLKAHLKTCNVDKLFMCELCGKQFTQNDERERHMSCHERWNDFKCERCGEECSSDAALKVHMRIHDDDKSFTCEVCGNQFANNDTLKIHTRIHTGEKPFFCNICGKNFRFRSNLRAHQKVHSSEKPFICELCGKQFAFNCSLKAHMEVHSTVKPFMCDICGKEFAFNRNLRNHIKIHSTKKSSTCEACEICGKQYVDISDLQAHMRIHTGEDPYICQLCGKKFTNNGALINHLRTHIHTVNI